MFKSSLILPLTLLAAAVGLPGALLAQSEFFANGPAFYGDPPDETHPWGVHDRNRPQPPVVTTAGAVTTPPPSDAVVLFDGKDLSGWELDKPKPGKEWVVKDGSMECVPGSGYIKTKEQFGDCQLHIEWAAPAEVKGDSQGRGNSGVFLMGATEVQVLDNYENPTYPDGSAGSVYGVAPPMANALNPPGEFNSYDIVFRRPIFQDGKMVDPGAMTVFCNGVLLQHATALEGGGGHKGRSRPRAFPEVGPLKLQDHGNPVRFRNIWYRPLPKRAAEGGSVGRMTAEATTAKRADIAASIREHAATLKGDDSAEFYRTMESLVYAHNDDAMARVKELSDGWIAGLVEVPADKMEDKKGDVMRMKGCLDYMIKHGRIDEGFAARGAVQSIIEKQGWNKKK